jgi:glycosyltransferase involved in cell wall biosynthesis
MKISIITPDLSHNCLGRAYLLAKILQKNYEVEIIGPIFGEEIWTPVADDKSITYKYIKLSGIFRPYLQIVRLSKMVNGDVCYVSKPIFSSLIVGIINKYKNKKPLVLDIDDWQMGFVKDAINNASFTGKLKIFASSFLLYNFGSYWNNLLCEKLIRYADDVTVSNKFLKDKFGGTIIPHGRDTSDFNPEKYDKFSIREKFGVEMSKKVVMFFGTPRTHKGIDNLIDALTMIRDNDVLLMLVGVDKKDPFSLELINLAKKRLNNNFIEFGLQPFDKIPEFLAVADVVVIPQKKNCASIGQVPAKVFDAMAMAKPIIATDVSDLPDILRGCGWIVEPENPEQLAKSIQYVLNNPDESNIIGWNARKKCINEYSWFVMWKELIKLFEKYEKT